MGGVQNTRGNSGGVGGGSLLWSKNGNSGEEGGSYVKFPPWWGYGYFLEPHNTIKFYFNIYKTFKTQTTRQVHDSLNSQGSDCHFVNKSTLYFKATTKYTVDSDKCSQ